MEEYLSQILDPLLQYLQANLPPPLYSFIVSALSHTFTVVTAIIPLFTALIDKNPSEWSTIAFLPPIMTIIAAYLAISTFYRTASWLIRVTFFFLKWASIVGIVMAIAQYFVYDGNDILENQGGNGRNNFMRVPKEGISSRNKNYQQSTQGSKPKPWHTFESHQEWQYQEDTRRVNSQAQKIMDSIVAAAGRVVQGDWLDAATKLLQVDELASTDETQNQGRARKTRSR